MKKEQTINEETELLEKQPSKLSLAFARIYFITAIISLIIFTITGSMKILKNGWTPGSIVLAALIGINYLILFACIIFASNAKSAKKNYVRAKKGLRIGKKLVKVVNACSAVTILVTTKLVSFIDYINLVFSVMQSTFAVLGLIISINRMIKKHKRKKKMEARKAALRATAEDLKNKALDIKNQIFGNKALPEEIDDNTMDNDDNIIDVDVETK